MSSVFAILACLCLAGLRASAHASTSSTPSAEEIERMLDAILGDDIPGRSSLSVRPTINYPSNTYSPNTYSPISYSSNNDSPNSYSPNSYSSNSYSSNSYSPNSYSSNSYSSNSYSPNSYSSNSYSSNSYSSNNYPSYPSYPPNYISQCGGYWSRQCLSGKRLSVGGVILEEKIATSYCDRSSNCTCVSFDVEFPVQNGVSAVSQYRMCMNSSMQDCSSLAKLHGLDERAKCTMSQCNTSNCNSFSQLETCPKLDSDDFQLWPKCSMKESWPILRCFTPLAVGYPYTSLSTCMSNMDQMYTCVRNYTDCLKGNCLDIFTDLGLRQYYKMIVDYAERYPTLTSLVTALNVSDSLMSSIAGYACHVKGGAQERQIKSMMSGLSYSDQLLRGPSASSYMPACDSRFLHDMVDVGITLAKKYFTLTSQKEVCGFIEESFEYAIHAWVARCSSKMFEAFIKVSLGPAFPDFTDVIIKAHDFVLKNWKTVPAVMCGKKEAELAPVTKSKICFSGTQLTSKLSSTTYGALSTQYCPINSQCGFSQERSFLSTTKHRGCVSPGRVIDVCPIPVTNTKGDRNNLVNCTSTTCSREMCNQPPRPHPDCPMPNPGKVQITPMCHLESKLDGLLSCFKPLLQAYPFSDLNTCKAKMAEPFNCVRNIALDCYSRVDCWDVFSASTTIRNYYPTLVSAFKNSSNIIDLIQYFVKGTPIAFSSNLLFEYACFVQGRRASQQLKAALAQAPTTLNMGPYGGINLGFCDNDLLPDIYKWSVNSTKQIFDATSNKDFCLAFNGLMDKFSNAYQTRCDTKASAVALSGLLQSITRSFPDVYKTVQVVEKLIAEFRLKCA